MADRIGCRHIEILNMEQKQDPMRSVLLAAMQKSITLSTFIQHLRDMRRKDVIQECLELIGELITAAQCCNMLA